MAKTFRFPKGEPLLDIASYARGGMRPPDRLTPAQVEQVRRTVQRVPEAVVKVLPRDSNDLKAAGKHLDYIGRYGELELEGDDGERLQGCIGNALLEDWDLDLDGVRQQSGLVVANGRKPPKLIHKLMFSMPPGTPPDKVLGAVRNLARQQFALQHRYAFVLHTDEPHPHVHLVLKAVSEQGVRLNIKKATLRHWRSEFARHLRLLGVAANATERAVRGESRSSKKDGIYRASQRGDSTYMRAQAEAVARDLLKGDIRVEPGKRHLVETRKHVVQGWNQVASKLESEGRHGLANDVRQFVANMGSPRTDRDLIAAELVQNVHLGAERGRSRSR
ncbi:MAG: relaxase [Gammaproteobacteria bacterium]|nr:MAG: relaxase [Gammaproteobacteria bacterium]